MLPTTAPLRVRTVVITKEGTIGLERPALMPMKTKRLVTEMVPVERVVTENVRRPDGKVGQVSRTVKTMVAQYKEVETTAYVPLWSTERKPVPVKACKFFVVTKDGKLEALDVEKATARLKKKTVVLTGDTTEVDPRRLELIKPGTLYLIVSPSPPPAPPREQPDAGKKGS